MKGLGEFSTAVARLVMPIAVCLFLIVLSAVPVYLPGFGAVAPDLPLVAVFFWGIYRPDLLPAPAVFAVGMAQDVMIGTPVGLHAAILLLAYGVMATQRRVFHGRSFLVMWWAFMMVALAAAVIGWVLMMVLNFRLLDPSPALFGALVTVAFYPFIALLLARLYQAIARIR